MESFKMWIFSFSGATAITALFRLLLSSSSLSKALNIFFTLFVLFYTVMPIQSLFKNDDLYIFSMDTQPEYNEIHIKGYEQIIELSVKNECEKLNIEVLSCEIDSYMNTDGTLIVESIVIQINNQNSAETVKEKIKEQLGYEVIVN